MPKPNSHHRDPSLDKAPSRYVVGIDLGTTNSAVCFIDTSRQPRRVEVFDVPQVVAAGQVEARQTLPSFHYEPAVGELEGKALALPWSDGEPAYVVGALARDHGAEVPARLIASAKSWLCHGGVDRTADLLPWHGAADVERLSPVEVSARYLQHVSGAWNARFPKFPLAQQDLVLTLPASFDEVARELTVQAASRAGLERVFLIEEPQAAFYAWLDAHADNWEQQVAPGDKILVCDVGGGTSDFTLIRVRRGADGRIVFHRVAVGDHLILGGDNLDLALAHHLEGQLAGDGKLEPRQWDVLVCACRNVKEQLLGENAPARSTVTLPGSGAKLIGGSRQIEVTRDDVQKLLLDGFLPNVGLDERPVRRASGFQEFGLPYAPDAALTRYMAAFLSDHRYVALEDNDDRPGGDPARPDIVLFNGGFFASPQLRARLLDVLCSWFGNDNEPWQPQLLDNPHLHLAVAHGAAYYGMVRRGEGVRISADLARTYYIGVESAEPSAVCLAPASAEAGQTIDLAARRFDLRISQPAEFPLYVSSTRLTDQPGELVPVSAEEMKSLPPIRTVLRARKSKAAETASVQLHARLSEIGTLELWCGETDGPRSWRLQFDVRSATQTDVAAHEGQAETVGILDDATWQACYTSIADTFGPDAQQKPAGLMKQLAKATGMSRDQWPPSLLRDMWEALMENEAGRRRSAAHESRWLNLIGFALRPGYGMAVDDWRVAETWRAVQGSQYPGSQAESWILWRRIGGGLAAGQQRAIADPVLASIRGLHRRTMTGKGHSGAVSLRPEESAEAWRLLGSLELLAVATKVELGKMLLDLMPKRKMQPVRAAMTWALGRLGTRLPLYGPLNTVVPLDVVSAWTIQLMDTATDDATEPLAVMQMARRTGDRHRDVSEKLRARIVDWLQASDASPHFVQLVREGGRLDQTEQGRIFGESLPKGLRIA